MLTEIEKRILGVMTDEGKLRGAVRESAAENDAIARDHIAAYRVQKLATIAQQITQLDNSKASLVAQKTLLESV